MKISVVKSISTAVNQYSDFERTVRAKILVIPVSSEDLILPVRISPWKGRKTINLNVAVSKLSKGFEVPESRKRPHR